MDQITDIPRGENSVANPITASYHGNHFHELKFDGGFVEDGGFCPTPEDMFHLNSASMSDPSSILEALQPCAEDIDVNVGDEYSTATAVRMNCSGDRSRTLISERRRRGRMKEKLYALRSLVPNITKVCVIYIHVLMWWIFFFNVYGIFSIILGQKLFFGNAGRVRCLLYKVDLKLGFEKFFSSFFNDDTSHFSFPF